MKKVFTALTVLVVALVLVGCGQSKSQKLADAATRDYIRSTVRNTNEQVEIYNKAITKKYELKKDWFKSMGSEMPVALDAFIVSPIDTMLIQGLEDFKGEALESYKDYLFKVVADTKSLLDLNRLQ
ncbi:MAG: hypothetical protein J6J57_04905 [Alistipes sp.]|nr:hypothetical protein [Alistipes sp.]